MIETYWNEVFGQYKNAEGKFEIPSLPEPLMSAHFGVRNIVGDSDLPASARFTLCVFPPREHSIDSKMQRQSLIEAIHDPQFWLMQKKLNPGAVDFIQRLLPFLASLTTPHYHYFLKLRGEILATAIVGEASCGCFLFNLVVDEKVRKQGLGKEMMKVIQNDFSHKRTFYWTRHDWFTADARLTPMSLV